MKYTTTITARAGIGRAADTILSADVLAADVVVVVAELPHVPGDEPQKPLKQH